MKKEIIGLVADIGGTNGRFALVNCDHELSEQRRYTGADFDDLAAMIEAYLNACGQAEPLKAVLAVAGAVADNRTRLTSNNWLVDGRELVRHGLFSSCLILNDFEALALALPFLREGDLLSVGKNGTVAEGRQVVIGPGTGLGTAFLTPEGPVAGEGGHISFAPIDEVENRTFGVVWTKICAGFGGAIVETARVLKTCTWRWLKSAACPVKI